MNIACDLDGTLAFYDKWRGIEHIGAPIEGTLKRVKAALAAGHNVVIFTARVAPSFSHKDDSAEATVHIQNWCLEHVGIALEVTAIKHGYFDEFWDDRAVGVAKNEGVARVPLLSMLWHRYGEYL